MKGTPDKTIQLKRKLENGNDMNNKKLKDSTKTENGDEEKDFNTGTSLVFSLPEDVGVLADALAIFKNRHVNLKHIESRPSKTNLLDYDFYVDIDESSTKKENIKLVAEDLKNKAKTVVIHQDESIPWFPRKISDLDRYAFRVLTYGAELDADHPGFKDPIYRARRKWFAEVANKHRHGEPLPYIEYTKQEIETWNTVFTTLTQLYPTHACRELNFILPLLTENCGYRVGNIPQLRDVSKFLKECTGFTLRPVAGLLSSRDFLAGLAFRVFHSTQYIRHHEKPMYTPEPDVVHELIGHVPMFADPNFAQFSQEIGLASLGAPDEWIDKLTALYWFTVEFGVCRQNGELRVYGAGILSSASELQDCLLAKEKHHSFDPEKMFKTERPITEYQKRYFISESFEDAKCKVREWTHKIDRPFTVRYNPYTECVETLDDKDKIIKLISDIRSDMSFATEALTKIH